MGVPISEDQEFLGNIKTNGTATVATAIITNATISGTFATASPGRASSGLGGASYAIPLMHGRNDNGAVLTASSGSGFFGISNTTGTSLQLSGEAANNNTKTDSVVWEVALPQFYKAADNITLTVNANYTLNSGTIGTKTLTALAYLLAADGTSGTTIIATAAATLTASKAAYAFVITGTTLTPGARVLIKLTMAIQETAAGGGIVGTINSAVLS